MILMTVHSAKGLEFPVVFMCGMEDGLFPGYMSINSEDPSDMEEERRLCYVAITRAMERLFILSARQRMLHGETQYNRPSRFLGEIPSERIAGSRDNVKRGMSAKDIMETMGRKETRRISKPSDRSMAKPIFESKAFEARQFKVKKADGLDYGQGDRVKHIKFGTGTVVAINDGGRDYEVTVEFDSVGVKKMFASFAKLKKV